MFPELDRYHKWLRRKRPHATTLRHYAHDLKLFFEWVKKTPAEVNVLDVDAFIEHCQQRQLATATINRRLAALRSLYRYLALEGSDIANPVVNERHFIPQGNRLPRDAQDSELQKLFDVIEDVRDRAIFLLMLRCGLRVGEICNLTLTDVHLEAAPGSLPRLWLHGKGQAERVAYLSAQPLAALVAWLNVRPKVKHTFVFVNCFGGALSISGVQKRLGHYCRLAGIRLSCHQFRHTFGRHLVEARVPVTTIQKLLGHIRLRTTEVYLHISGGQVQADYDAAMAEIARRLTLKELQP